jgi:hypothetical protein
MNERMNSLSFVYSLFREAASTSDDPARCNGRNIGAALGLPCGAGQRGENRLGRIHRSTTLFGIFYRLADWRKNLYLFQSKGYTKWKQLQFKLTLIKGLFL